MFSIAVQYEVRKFQSAFGMLSVLIMQDYWILLIISLSLLPLFYFYFSWMKALENFFFIGFLVIYLFLAVLGLCCCAGFSLVAWAGATLCYSAFHCSGISCCRAQARGHTDFSSCSTSLPTMPKVSINKYTCPSQGVKKAHLPQFIFHFSSKL